VSFVVKNTGGRAGKEVAQVYIRDEVSSVTTPVMRLAGFEKIELPPGESRTVTVTIPPSELSLWNVAMKRVVEPGWFSVLVGASAADIRLRGRFEVVVGEQAHD
jgi:beta-glucosidase